MNDEEAALENEELPVDADAAFQDYINLGSRRSILMLHHQYTTRCHQDPFAAVPTRSLQSLLKWEKMYNWRVLAMEHDVESVNAYNIQRKAILEEVYRSNSNRARLVLEKGEAAVRGLNPEKFSPQEALKYIESGSKMLRDSEESVIKLSDPKEEASESVDFFDTFRKLGLMQINNTQNIYMGPNP